jgi:hypothetical protein
MKNYLTHLKPYFLLLLLYLGVISYTQAQINLSNPGDVYIQNFNGATDSDGNTFPDLASLDWSFENANSDDKTWTIVGGIGQNGENIARGGTGLCAGYPWSVPNAANDWMFSPALTLTEGATYRLTFYYAALNAGATTYPENLEVFIGTGNNVTGMTTSLQDFGAISNNTYQQATIEITVGADGDYYLGWYAYSDADQYWLRIDDVSIINVPANDVAPLSVSLPDANTTDCATFTATTNIEVEVGNLGSANQDAFDLNYTVTGANVGSVANSSVVVPALTAGGTITVSFTADLSVGDTYTIALSTALDGDENTANDDFSDNVLSPEATLANEGDIYDQGFENIADLSGAGWTAENVNGDTQTWDTFNNAGFANSGATFAVCFKNNANAGDDWLFSNCLSLVAGQSYRVSFFKRANGGTTENLSISIGTSAASGGMSTELGSYQGFTENSYELTTEDFTVDNDGTYYLGWHMTSPTSANDGESGILLDDIRILAVPAVDIAITEVLLDIDTEDCANFTATSPIDITVTNQGSATQANFQINYTVVGANTGEVLNDSETVTSLAPGAEYSFTVNADLSVPDTYTITVTNTLADALADNDEISGDVTNPLADLTGTSANYAQNFDGDDIPGWSLENTNDDDNSWALGANPALANSGENYFFCLTNNVAANDDWLFSNCIELSANTVYEMIFSYRTNALNEALNISLGSAADVASMTRQLFSSNTLLSNGSYTTVTVEFAVESAGVYHIGFHNVSPLTAVTPGGSLRIDDVSITNTNTAIQLPEAPTNLTLGIPNPLESTLALTWTASADASGYVVERSTGGVNYSVINSNVTSTTYNDESINFDINYSYRVKAVNALGESGYSNIASLQITAIENNSIARQIQVYPNPSADKIYLDFSNPSFEVTGIELLNTSGSSSKVWNGTNNSGIYEISLSDRPAGMYFIKVETNKGIAVKKVIKQ